MITRAYLFLYCAFAVSALSVSLTLSCRPSDLETNEPAFTFVPLKELTLNQLFYASDTIAVCTLLKFDILGDIQDGTTVSEYKGSRFVPARLKARVVEVIRGDIAASDVVVEYLLSVTKNSGYSERPGSIGSNYILFLNTNGDSYRSPIEGSRFFFHSSPNKVLLYNSEPVRRAPYTDSEREEIANWLIAAGIGERFNDFSSIRHLSTMIDIRELTEAIVSNGNMFDKSKKDMCEVLTNQSGWRMTRRLSIYCKGYLGRPMEDYLNEQLKVTGEILTRR